MWIVVAAVGVGVAGLAAADSSLPSAVPLTLLSAAGGALIAILSGKIVVPTFAYNREKDRADRLEREKVEIIAVKDTEIARQNLSIQDKHVPALEAATAAIKEAVLVMHDIEREWPTRHPRS